MVVILPHHSVQSADRPGLEGHEQRRAAAASRQRCQAALPLRAPSSLAVSSPIPSDPPVMNACRLDSMPGGSVRRAAGGRMGVRSERESDVVTAAVVSEVVHYTVASPTFHVLTTR